MGSLEARKYIGRKGSHEIGGSVAEVWFDPKTMSTEVIVGFREGQGRFKAVVAPAPEIHTLELNEPVPSFFSINRRMVEDDLDFLPVLYYALKEFFGDWEEPKQGVDALHLADMRKIISKLLKMEL